MGTSDPKESAADRIQKIMDVLDVDTKAAAARTLGISRGSLHRVLNTGRIGSKVAHDVQNATGYAHKWLRTGTGPMMKQAAPPESPPHAVAARRVLTSSEAEGDFVYVRKAKGRAAAGSGMVPEQGLLAETYGFRREWLGMTRTSSTDLMLVEVTGTSMLPVFEDGDLVLVDGQRAEPKHGRYYVITILEDDELKVKRLDKMPSGRWRTTSLEDIEGSKEYAEHEIKFHGEVIWLGRTLVKP